MFLQASGKALAIPFLPSIAPKAMAQEAGSDQYYIQFITNHGHMHEDFFPASQYLPQTLAPGESAVYYRSLAEIPDPISVGIGPEFSDLKSKISILDGLAVPVGEHEHNFSLVTAATSLNAQAQYCNSVDVVLAESGKLYSVPTSLPLLLLRPSFDGAYPYNLGVSFKNKDTASYSYIQSTVAAWNRIFPEAALGANDLALKRAKQKKITDLILQDYKSVLASKRLGAEDRQAFSQYVEFVDELSVRLQTGIRECPVIREETRVGVGIDYNAQNQAILGAESLDQRINNHIDLLVAAIACGATKVASFYLSCGYFNNAIREDYGQLHGPIGHTIDDPSWRVLASQNAQWRGAKFARLVRGLNNIQLSSGDTLLDRGITYYGNEYGGVLHGIGRMHVMVAGSGGGKIRPGYYIDYRHVRHPTENINGIARPYNNFLVTLYNAFGLTPADYERGGNAGTGEPYKWIGHHERDGVKGFDSYSSDAEKRKTLPYFYMG
jgi:hypothetical protein